MPRRTLALLLFLLPSCASLSVSRSGFLDDYSRLERANDREVAFIPDEVWLWAAEEHAIGSIYIEPVVYLQPEDTKHVPDEEGVEWLTTAFENYLRRGLDDSYEIVDEPRADTAIVRAAVTDVNPSNIWLNTVAVIVAVACDMGGVAGEIEVVSAATGERIAAMTAVRDGTPFLVIECFQRYGHAYHGMMKWGRELRDVLDERRRDGSDAQAASRAGSESGSASPVAFAAP